MRSIFIFQCGMKKLAQETFKTFWFLWVIIQPVLKLKGFAKISQMLALSPVTAHIVLFAVEFPYPILAPSQNQGPLISKYKAAATATAAAKDKRPKDIFLLGSLLIFVIKNGTFQSPMLMVCNSFY